MLLLTAIYWAVWLFAFSPPWTAIATGVIETGILLAATVAIAGILLEHSRLAYKVGWSYLVSIALVALLRPLGPGWFIGVLLAGLTALTMANRTLNGWIRSEPPVAPVPNKAIGLALLLLATPTMTAIATASRSAGILPWLALVCWFVLFWYVRRLPGAMGILRGGLPVLMGAGWWLPDPARPVWMVMVAAAASLAWTSVTRLAVRPLIERGSRITIPSELLPDEIRRAIDIDRTKR
jgi:hypothetical protein